MKVWSPWPLAQAEKINTSLPPTHVLNQAGAHTLKYWVIDPGVVLQKIIIDLGGVKQAYLGPPESPYRE